VKTVRNAPGSNRANAATFKAMADSRSLMTRLLLVRAIPEMPLKYFDDPLAITGWLNVFVLGTPSERLQPTFRELSAQCFARSNFSRRCTVPPRKSAGKTFVPET